MFVYWWNSNQNQLCNLNKSFGKNLFVFCVLALRMSKPNVLILGGMGFIGRNMVQYLVENSLANKIRSVDKVLASTANLGAGHAEAFENPNVLAMQANLTSEGMTAKTYNKLESLLIFFFTTSWYPKSFHSF